MTSISAANQVASTKHGVIIVLAAVMPAMAIISLVPVLPLLMKEFAAVEGSNFLVPMALTIPALCIALFSPFAGWLSDKAGRKKLLILSLLLYAIIGIIPFFLTDLILILISRIGLGITEAVIMTVSTALIGDYFQGKDRERWIGIQVASVSLSAIFLIAIGGALGEMIGSRGPFLLYLIAIPIAFLAAIFLYEPVDTKNKSEEKVSFPFLLIAPLLLITLIVGIFFYTTIVKLGPILLLSGELSPAVIGMVGAGFNIGACLGTILFTRIKFLSGPALLIIGFIFFTAGYGGMGMSSSLVMTIVFAIITSLGAGMLLPTMLTWTMSLLPANVRGRGTGLWTAMFYLGQFIAPVVVASIQAQVGGLANVLAVYSVVALAVVLFSCFRLKGSQGLSIKNAH